MWNAKPGNGKILPQLRHGFGNGFRSSDRKVEQENAEVWNDRASVADEFKLQPIQDN